VELAGTTALEAGMTGLLILLLLVSAPARKLPEPKFDPVWHRASLAECEREADAEWRLLRLAGLDADPGITLGWHMSFSTYFASLNRCGYTDGSSFRPLCLRLDYQTKESKEFDCGQFWLNQERE
jgi:hypothetical protein